MKNNKVIFYVLAFLQGLVFYSSVATLYRQANGLSLAEMGVIESIFALCIILFEIPLGFMCDRIGYKKMMILCNGLYFISKCVFWQATGFLGFLLERILLAFVNAGLSGCDSSLLYCSIDENESAHVFGVYQMMGVCGMVSASISFSLFFSDNFKGAALATMIAYLLAFLITFLLQDTTTVQKQMPVRALFKDVFKDKTMILFLIASSLFVETTHTITIFYSQLQYVRAKIPVTYYGVIFMCLQLCGLFSGLSGKLTRRLGQFQCIKILVVGGCGLCASLIFVKTPLLSIVILALLTLCESLYYPLLNTINNQHIQASSRASILSIYSMIMNLTSMMTQTLFGQAADVSLTSAYGLGMIFCILAFLLLSYKKDFSKE